MNMGPDLLRQLFTSLKHSDFATLKAQCQNPRFAAELARNSFNVDQQHGGGSTCQGSALPPRSVASRKVHIDDVISSRNNSTSSKVYDLLSWGSLNNTHGFCLEYFSFPSPDTDMKFEEYFLRKVGSGERNHELWLTSFFYHPSDPHERSRPTSAHSGEGMGHINKLSYHRFSKQQVVRTYIPIVATGTNSSRNNNNMRRYRPCQLPPGASKPSGSFSAHTSSFASVLSKAPLMKRTCVLTGIALLQRLFTTVAKP
ncbi:hypothetical protein F2P81_012126 [Scophthalmus maximus]|uniref:Uncharacterized protein n=1 Tax=Scophthalmus maximus TaxID=52904 RepID=A0A6A4T0N6_SCOMX|nr:hypothetical protein F2P81_012126 [Scophthalmus maximus]